MSTILKIFVPNQNLRVKDIQLFPNWYSMPPRLHFYQTYETKTKKNHFRKFAFFLSNRLQFFNFQLLMATYHKKLKWEGDV